MFQKLIDILYRNPRSKFRLYSRFGGYWNYKKMLQGMQDMKVASLGLPPIQSVQGGLQIYFLTGKNFIYQTLFCIQSLAKVSPEKYEFILVDDGSFDEELIRQIEAQLPGAKIATAKEINNNLNEVLNIKRYPYLHHKRKEYPHIKKLTDVHSLPYSAWKVVIDSDMLFWSNPEAFNNWLKKPDKPVYMVDSEESYGYSRNLMKKLCGSDTPNFLNVGIIGLESKSINWDAIEHWAKEMEQSEGKSYYLEQALSAMIIGDKESLVLNKEDYIVYPSKKTVENFQGILHHYVDLSKEHYFKFAWKEILK